MNKKFQGTIQIARMSGAKMGNCIHITIQEDNSGIEFFDGVMSMEDFAFALTSSSRPIEFELRPERVGWIAENKTELVPRVEVLSDKKKREQLIKKALEPFEVDGWSARESDMENGHCRVGNFQRVVFFRHVPHETTPTQ